MTQSSFKAHLPIPGMFQTWTHDSSPGDHLCSPQALARLLITKSDEQNTSIAPALKMIRGAERLAEVVSGTRVLVQVCLSPGLANHNATQPHEALGASPVCMGPHPLAVRL